MIILAHLGLLDLHIALDLHTILAHLGLLEAGAAVDSTEGDRLETGKHIKKDTSQRVSFVLTQNSSTLKECANDVQKKLFTIARSYDIIIL